MISGYIGLVAVCFFIYLIFFRKKKEKKTKKKNNWIVPVAILVLIIGIAGGGKTVLQKVQHHPPVLAAPGNLSGNVALGQQMAASYGWGSGSQWNCLYILWEHESGWSATALNPSSGATGIPQLLPSVHAIPANWSSPSVQIAWGLSYIKGRWGSPCGAWDVYCNHPGGPAGCWY